MYRRDVCAEKNIIDYALFVSFFPHIMSGPIARANSLLPQLKNPRAFKFENLTDGAQRFIYGLLKKAVVADWLATFNNAILYKLHSENPLTILAAVLLFSLQLYFDFSGYCDMALGCARMLGIDLIENFKAPYFSKSFSEIWSRWHISLTGWFRDYIYIPLGGNRKGLFRKLLNIAVVFLISGLWHGAAWGFIVWGLLHGALRIIEDCFRAVCNKRDKQHPKMQSSFMSILKTGCVYFVWSLTFVFFRLDSVSESIYAITRCFAVSEFSARSLAARGLAIMQANTVSSFGYIVALLIIVALSALFVLVCEYKFIYKSTDKISDRHTCFVLRNFTKNTRFAITAIMILAIMLTGRFGVSNFVYFQF
ncbi:MAG: MBOAT family O-acyltransferase [Oscillospiraceae bacterium]